jgi:hypothetical protein
MGYEPAVEQSATPSPAPEPELPEEVMTLLDDLVRASELETSAGAAES